jgi:hypothetical protein
MRKIFRINFIIFLLLLISENSFAESKLGKIKDKIKTGEDKLIGKYGVLEIVLNIPPKLLLD